jgi:hypothetical protein
MEELNTAQLVQEGQEVAQANANRKPEDIAASFFSQYYPSYKALLGRLSKKEATRLADALVAWPLEIETPKFADDNGRTAFRLGIQLIDCKMVMRNVIEMENMENVVDETE